jgi:protein O-mannosyl-transferase
LAGASYYQTTTWRNSETLWRHAIAVTNNNYIAYNNLGNTLRKERKPDEAIVQYRKALETCTKCPGVMKGLGYVFADKGEWQEALEWYQRAMESWPGAYAGNNNDLGIALVHLGRTDEALVQFQEAVRLDGKFIDAHYNLGLLLKQLGRPEEAKKQFEEVLRLVPNNPTAMEQLRQLQSGK